MLTAKLAKRVTQIQKDPPHLGPHLLVAPHLQATPQNLSQSQKAKRLRKR